MRRAISPSGRSVRWSGGVHVVAWWCRRAGSRARWSAVIATSSLTQAARLGWLEWRPQPRERLGWYLLEPGGSPVRLGVDVAIEDLAAAGPDHERGWAVIAELAALLSTALALDA